MALKKNDIIDYFDSKRICCGQVLDLESNRIRVLSDRGQETKISPSRVLSAVTHPGLANAASKDESVMRLREIASRREKIKDDLDLRELWEVVGYETDDIGVDDLTDLLFGRNQDPDSSASLMRAITEDKLYFKIRPTGIEVNSPERVEQALVQRAREREHQELVLKCSDFLAKLYNRDGTGVDAAPEELVPLLEEAALRGKDWIGCKAVKEIFAQAGLVETTDPFRALVKLGVWSHHENVRLRAEQVPLEFSSQALSDAQAACSRDLPQDVEDLTGLATIAIDSETTRDVDDAVSLTFEGDDAILGIHITDVAHFVDHGSPLDLEIRERATSLYLPDRTIPMIPPLLSEGAASLCAGEERPTLSVLVRLGPDASIKEWRVSPAMIRLSERLTYEQADERISRGESTESSLSALAAALRQARVDGGAVVFKDPELSVKVGEGDTIDVSVRDKESPSQVLVSEAMILANGLVARFLRDHNLPAIFRSQPAPSEKIELGEGYDPVLSYRAKKAMARGDVGPAPLKHFTLGLDAYTTATSPLRRYQDLLVQRQIKSFLGTGRPVMTRDDIENLLAEISYPLERGVAIERERRRYFLLAYLERRKREELEAVVLQRFPRFHLVQIEALCFNAALHVNDDVALNPYDRVLARVQKVNPREDRLTLSLIRLL